MGVGGEVQQAVQQSWLQKVELIGRPEDGSSTLRIDIGVLGLLDARPFVREKLAAIVEEARREFAATSPQYVEFSAARNYLAQVQAEVDQAEAQARRQAAAVEEAICSRATPAHVWQLQAAASTAVERMALASRWLSSATDKLTQARVAARAAWHATLRDIFSRHAMTLRAEAQALGQRIADAVGGMAPAWLQADALGEAAYELHQPRSADGHWYRWDDLDVSGETSRVAS